MASTNSRIRITADVDFSRLANVLHAQQAHPDYEYSVTFPHCADAHTSREGWERNPQADQTPHAIYPQMLGWRRLKGASD